MTLSGSFIVKDNEKVFIAGGMRGDTHLQPLRLVVR